MQTKCNFVLFHENRQNIHLCDNIQVKGKTSNIVGEKVKVLKIPINIQNMHIALQFSSVHLLSCVRLFANP